MDSINNEGETALILAVKRENLELVNIMLNLGASPDIITPDGDNAQSLAETSGNIEVLNLLRWIIPEKIGKTLSIISTSSIPVVYY